MRMGKCLQVRYEHASGNVEAYVRDLEFLEEFGGTISSESAVLDVHNVVDDHFRGAEYGHCFREFSGERIMVGYIHDKCVYGCGGNVVGDVEGSMVEVDIGVGEEDDAGKVMLGEEAGDVCADTTRRAEDEDGTWGCHGNGIG